MAKVNTDNYLLEETEFPWREDEANTILKNEEQHNNILWKEKKYDWKCMLTTIPPTVSMARRASGYGEGIPVSDSFWNSEEGMLIG